MYERGKVEKVLGNKIGITSHYIQGCLSNIISKKNARGLGINAS